MLTIRPQYNSVVYMKVARLLFLCSNVLYTIACCSDGVLFLVKIEMW